MKTIATIKNGELSLCQKCNVYHLSYNNLFFEFTPEGLKSFKDYIFEIEVDYWENRYENTKIKRKIPIPSIQQNLFLMFNRYEIEELKSLFLAKSEKKIDLFLNPDDIDYTYHLN